MGWVGVIGNGWLREKLEWREADGQWEIQET